MFGANKMIISLIIIAVILWSSSFVGIRAALIGYSPLEVISYSTWIATLMLLPFGNGVIDVVSIANISATTAVIYIGIVTVIAHICWSKILSKIEASKAAVFLYTVPVMTIIIGFLWLRELPSLISCLGGAIILGGVVLSNSKTAGTEQAY
jgi:drug/metabolite transporter (DMT)-like permease